MKSDIRQYQHLAQQISKEYENHPNLIGIIWIGSSSFGVIDGYSDIDIRVLLESDEKSFPMKQSHINGIKVEVEEMDWDWLMQGERIDDERFWIREKAVVLHDPSGDITSIFKQTNNRLKKEYDKQLWEAFKEIMVNYEIEKSIKRGDMQTATLYLNKSSQAIVRFLLLYYGRIVPPMKWLMYFLRKNESISQETLKHIEDLLSDTLLCKDKFIVLRNIQDHCKALMLKKGYDEKHIAEYWRY